MLRVKMFADNDHLNLEADINRWLRRRNPRVLRWWFITDGSEFTYLVMAVYRTRGYLAFSFSE
jgi:hypothetical protein